MPSESGGPQSDSVCGGSHATPNLRYGADGGLVGQCPECMYTFTVLDPDRTPPHFEQRWADDE